MKAYIALPAVAALVYRAYSRKSLTPLGIASAGMTGLAHALHPFSLPFALLFVFYFGCMRATRVKHEIKAKLTLNAAGGTGGEGTRIHTQVFANSLSGSLLCIMYALHYYLDVDEKPRYGQCWTWGAGASTQDVLLVGIIANYAAVTADTFSSELGILSTKPPRLITSRTFKRVPHGTNGGVSSVGTLAGVLEAFLIAVATVILLPVCDGWSAWQNLFCLCTVTSCGLFGTLIDSFLGGCLQETIIDSDTGKVLEANGGKRVTPPSHHIHRMAFFFWPPTLFLF
ncbi:DUF92 domain-containing protein [Mollisia scopiformis]|uniref:DUF92 domain-containing protein n=1 Tax=Mollisia scopiformis TaxID=149040 RepID=A0A132B6N2_MOLSC|nr:DUF92 domain-containing protein [Mollisia scopiformis]KUJ08068.1 DUF92 domain-containing protein [Mollisia scopiformis]